MLTLGFISTSTDGITAKVTNLVSGPFSPCLWFLPIQVDEASLAIGLSVVEGTMIQLTRLNHHPLAVNSDLIKFVEQAPDTVITLLNGEKIVVRESAQEVLERVVEFRRSVLQGIMLWWDNRAAILSAAENNRQTNEEK